MTTLNLGQALGEPIKLQLGGKEYLAHPLRLGDFAAFETWLREQRLATLLNSPAAARLDPRVKASTIAMLLAGVFNEADLLREMTTVTGMAFLVWRSLLRGSPEMTMEQVLEISGGPAEALKAIAMLSGLSKMEEPSIEDQKENPTGG